MHSVDLQTSQGIKLLLGCMYTFFDVVVIDFLCSTFSFKL